MGIGVIETIFQSTPFILTNLFLSILFFITDHFTLKYDLAEFIELKVNISPLRLKTRT